MYNIIYYTYLNYLTNGTRINQMKNIKYKIKYHKIFIKIYMLLMIFHQMNIFFDKNNIIHRLLIDSFIMVCKILKMNYNNNLYKTIVVAIHYKNKNIFMGNILVVKNFIFLYKNLYTQFFFILNFLIFFHSVNFCYKYIHYL